MKKILSVFIAIFLCSQASFAANSATLNGAIQKYKAQNYVGCIQDAKDIVKKDPANATAYYYLAISYSKVGKKDEAIDAFQKVITLSTNTTLVEYATKGSSCLSNPEQCKEDEKKKLNLDGEIDKFIKSGSSYSQEAKKQIQDIHMQQLKNNINSEADQKSEMPTNDEIAEAVKTLARAGVNPMPTSNPYTQAQQSLYQNPEYMQLQMLMGSNNNNNGGDFMNMLPYFMAQNQSGTGANKNLSADAIKNMMMSSMMGSLSTTFDMDNKY